MASVGAEAALALAVCQLSVLPVRTVEEADKSAKSPRLGSWKEFQSKLMDESQIVSLFCGDNTGVALIGGAVSGNLECIDFDGEGELFNAWCKLLHDNGADFYKRCYIERTPSGGYHVIYRWECPPDLDDMEKRKLGLGNQKLATKFAAVESEGQHKLFGKMLAAEKRGDGWAVRYAPIETRGEGGYFVVAPSEGYSPLRGDLAKLPVLTLSERDALISAARYFDEKEPEATESHRRAPKDIRRAGDDYAERTSWADIIEPHGWRHSRTIGNVEHWTRPGKDHATSATTNATGYDTLYVFTSSSIFEPNRSYTKFAAYAHLEHGGNMQEAAKALRQSGFGEVQSTVSEMPPKENLNISNIYISRKRVEVKPNFLWEPYVQRGKMAILDAAGGTSKTSVSLAIAGCLSNGWLPWDQAVEPCRTLYYGREDDIPELETVYYASGGKENFIGIVPANFPFNARGLERVRNDIEQFKPTLVVFDPLIAFLDGVVANINDPMPIQRVLDALAAVATDTGAAILNIRHTSKPKPGMASADLGMGSVQFRNRHRSQLMTAKHPDQGMYPRVIVLSHDKASLLVIDGDPIAFERQGNAIHFRRDVLFDEPAKQGRPDEKLAKGKAYLLEAAKYGYVEAKTAYRWGEANDIDDSTMKRARKALGFGYEQCDGMHIWTNPKPETSEFDPFHDA